VKNKKTLRLFRREAANAFGAMARRAELLGAAFEALGAAMRQIGGFLGQCRPELEGIGAAMMGLPRDWSRGPRWHRAYLYARLQMRKKQGA
jgi:hypothetical protein